MGVGYLLVILVLYGFKLLELGFMISALVMAFQLPKAAGRNWFLVGTGLLLSSNVVVGFSVFGGRLSGIELLSVFGIVGGFPAWFCLFMGVRRMVVVLSSAGESALGTLSAVGPQERGTSLLITGVLGLLVWPLAPYVRVQSLRYLAAIDAGEIAESQRWATQKASVLGWLGTLLLVGGGLSILIVVLTMMFEMSPSGGIRPWG